MLSIDTCTYMIVTTNIMCIDRVEEDHNHHDNKLQLGKQVNEFSAYSLNFSCKPI